MAPAPSVGSSASAHPSTDDQGLRQRLFSLSRKKHQQKGTTHEKSKENVGVIAENLESANAAPSTEPVDSSASTTAIGDQGQDPSSATAPVNVSLTSSAPAGASDDKEQGSLNTTLTGTNPRNMFYHRAGNKSSTSQAAASHSSSKPSSRRNRPKPSFARFVSKLVPCVGPDSAMKDVDEGPQMAERQSDAGRQNPLRDSQVPTSLDAALLTPPTINIERPPSRADSEIVVPPPQLLPEDETDGVTSGAVQPPGSTGELIARTHTRDSSDGSDGTSFTDDEAIDHRALDEQSQEERLIRNGGTGILIGMDGEPKPLLPPLAPEHAGRKCLVLDLDETLVHSSFKPIAQPDFIVPVEIEMHWHHFHVLKRPGVEEFLRQMGELYEVVVFTASLNKYADPVLDKLDTHRVVAHRLYRESCFSHKGNYVKDLSQLGRPIGDTIILDNSPASYIFHPNNAVPVSSWFNDPHDVELTDLVPFLSDLSGVSDVRGILNLGI
ncbi:unnamed protein product [Mycena citricolor]|uniref:protein-serine/threonine phosphatase n=1 Tax=Mycena citricolor TaxID=2018698 RepID=A0AAD2K6D5_9AGAR|nr:unnamed protein product [Mycena citricolor]